MTITVIFRSGNKTTIKNIDNAVYNHTWDKLVIVRGNKTEEYYGENIAKYIVEVE